MWLAFLIHIQWNIYTYKIWLGRINLRMYLQCGMVMCRLCPVCEFDACFFCYDVCVLNNRCTHTNVPIICIVICVANKFLQNVIPMWSVSILFVLVSINVCVIVVLLCFSVTMCLMCVAYINSILYIFLVVKHIFLGSHVSWMHDVSCVYINLFRSL